MGRGEREECFFSSSFFHYKKMYKLPFRFTYMSMIMSCCHISSCQFTFQYYVRLKMQEEKIGIFKKKKKNAHIIPFPFEIPYVLCAEIRVDHQQTTLFLFNHQLIHCSLLYAVSKQLMVSLMILDQNYQSCVLIYLFPLQNGKPRLVLFF